MACHNKRHGMAWPGMINGMAWQEQRGHFQDEGMPCGMVWRGRYWKADVESMGLCGVRQHG